MAGRKEFASGNPRASTFMSHKKQGIASGTCHSRRVTEQGWTLDSDQQYYSPTAKQCERAVLTSQH